MNLISVSARGFKGSDFKYYLAEISLFHGNNFRGKTRIMDAIRLGLLGWLPELGKSNRNTFSLASSNQMEVCLKFEDGTILRRCWILKGNTVSTDHTVPENFKTEDFAVMLNAEEYFALSDRKRMEYVFEHCPSPTELRISGIVSRIEAATNAGCVETEPVARFMDQFNEGDFVEGRPSEFIDQQVENVTSIYKDSKAAAVRAEKTIQGLMGMRLNDEDVGPSVNDLEAKRSALQSELHLLHAEKGGLASQYDRELVDHKRYIDLTRMIDVKTGVPAALATLNGKLSALPVGDYDPVSIADLTEKLATLSHKQSEVKTLIADHETHERRSSRELSQVDDKDECPYCGATGEGWKDTKRHELNVLISTAKSRVAELRVNMSENDAEYMKVDAELVIFQKAKDNAECQRTERYAVVAQIVLAEADVKSYDSMIAERDRLPERNDQLTADVEVLDTKIKLKSEEITGVDTQIKTVTGRAFELKRLADAENLRNDAQMDTKVAEIAGKELRSIQNEMVADAFAPLLERANSFFGDVLLSPLGYNALSGGEIGTWRDGKWIGHRTMSGTEKLLVYAAIQAALAMTSPLRLMLMDELGRLDAKSVAGVLAAVNTAIEEKWLDGFIGIDTSLRLTGIDSSRLQVIEIS